MKGWWEKQNSVGDRPTLPRLGRVVWEKQRKLAQNVYFAFGKLF
jgi:hypothetical protein